MQISVAHTHNQYAYIYTTVLYMHTFIECTLTYSQYMYIHIPRIYTCGMGKITTVIIIVTVIIHIERVVTHPVLLLA